MGRGWVITTPSGDVDWRIAVGALAAAAEVPVAAVVVGEAVADGLARPHLAALLELRAAGQLSLRQARDLVAAVGRAHGMVLIAAPTGLLMPAGRGDWTAADLAAEVGAQALVMIGPRPDAVGHATLTLDALAGQGIAASVVTVGDVDEDALPLTPAGRIPADPPPDFAGAAGWFDPMLRADGGPATAYGPVTAGRRPPVSGRRIVLALLTVFAVMVAVACGLGLSSRDWT